MNVSNAVTVVSLIWLSAILLAAIKLSAMTRYHERRKAPRKIVRDVLFNFLLGVIGLIMMFSAIAWVRIFQADEPHNFRMLRLQHGRIGDRLITHYVFAPFAMMGALWFLYRKPKVGSSTSILEGSRDDVSLMSMSQAAETGDTHAAVQEK
jgi:uncharacterized BrkB/YihY/UPF0761 family membrane protein